jgi:hypothetical protein
MGQLMIPNSSGQTRSITGRVITPGFLDRRRDVEAHVPNIGVFECGLPRTFDDADLLAFVRRKQFPGRGPHAPERISFCVNAIRSARTAVMCHWKQAQIAPAHAAGGIPIAGHGSSGRSPAARRLPGSATTYRDIFARVSDLLLWPHGHRRDAGSFQIANQGLYQCSCHQPQGRGRRRPDSSCSFRRIAERRSVDGPETADSDRLSAPGRVISYRQMEMRNP